MSEHNQVIANLLTANELDLEALQQRLAGLYSGAID